MGGMATAIRNIDGTDKSPELVITNTRDPGRPEMTSIDKFIGTEFRSRYINPTWIEGMKKEGYAGAGERRSVGEYLWGWDATVTETVTDSMWQETFSVYVEDKHNLDMQEFFASKSPFAYQDITARMAETMRKGTWQADAATKKRVLEEYIDSVNRHGVGCSEHTCGNPRFQTFVMEQAKLSGIPVPAIEGFREAMERATQEAIGDAAERMESFVSGNEAQLQARLEAVPAPSRAARELDGYLMEQERRDQPQAARSNRGDRIGGEYAVVAASVPVLAVLFAWRWRRRRAS
jgi:cobaltochelatase CobN